MVLSAGGRLLQPSASKFLDLLPLSVVSEEETCPTFLSFPLNFPHRWSHWIRQQTQCFLPLIRNREDVPYWERSHLFFFRRLKDLLCSRDCRASYVGETGRSFSTRISEHVDGYENRNPGKLAFAQLLLDRGLIPVMMKYVLLLYEDNYRRRIAFENIEMMKKTAHYE